MCQKTKDSVLSKHLTKKRTLEKRVQIVFFVYFFQTKKMRSVRTIILAAVSRRDLCYVSENEGFRFDKKCVQSAFYWAQAEFVASSGC